MKQRKFTGVLAVTILALLGAPLSSCAQTPQGHAKQSQTAARLPDTQIAKISNDALAAFHTPGMAVTIVSNGKVVFSQGFGVRNIGTQAPVNTDTLFRIASTTKAFTSAALAILVDEGKLGWDDKVTQYLPDFAMSDPWVTREFTVRDLLTHRSGLGLGAGDLMLWPEPSGFSRKELIHNLRYLKPVSSFRSQYAYDNLLYIVAGEVVAAASGSTWETFVQSRILDPLKMGCHTGKLSKFNLRNTAIPYGYVDEVITEITRNRIENASNVSAPAGGLVCNANGISTWMLTQLGGGVAPDGTRIFSAAARDEMWRGQTILKVSAAERKLDNTHFKTYALGWRKEDMHGYEVISHTGTLSGFQAYIALVPELDLGVAVLNNGSNSGARSAVVQSVLKAYMGEPKTDWAQYYVDRQAQRAAEKKSKPKAINDNGGDQTARAVSRPIADYAGLYQDPWFGKVDIIQSDGHLRFASRKMVKLVGTLEPYDHNTFIVRWDDREFRADAYIDFSDNIDGAISGMTMRHVDPEGDWSFDFQDLNFSKSKS